MAQAIRTLTDFHNKYFGTELTINDWKSYYVFRNKGWGTIEGKKRRLYWCPDACLTTVVDQRLNASWPCSITKSILLHICRLYQTCEPPCSVFGEWAVRSASTYDCFSADAGLWRLTDPCHIVTNRSWKQRDMVIEWLKSHDLYHLLTDIHFVGAFDFVDDVVVDGVQKKDTNKELLTAFKKNQGKKHKVKVGCLAIDLKMKS